RGGEMSSRVVRVDDAGQVQVYLLLDEYRPEHVAALEGLGLRVEITLPDFRLVQGWLPSDAVDAVAALDFVRQIKPPGYRHNHVGAVTSEGDAIVNGPAARSAFNVSGSGVRVGVMSDGVDHLANSVASGDLPPDVQVLKAGSGDEGTAIMEVVHDIAPGA